MNDFRENEVMHIPDQTYQDLATKILIARSEKETPSAQIISSNIYEASNVVATVNLLIAYNQSLECDIDIVAITFTILDINCYSVESDFDKNKLMEYLIL